MIKFKIITFVKQKQSLNLSKRLFKYKTKNTRFILSEEEISNIDNAELPSLNKRTKKFFFIKQFINYNLINNLIKQKINNVFKKKLDIKIKSNNIFCTFSQIEKNLILHNGSAGKYKIKLSKKLQKVNSKNILDIFFDILEKEYEITTFNSFIINLISPVRLRKKIIRKIFEKINKNHNFYFKLKTNKCFNGCRARKVRRKKN